MNPKSCGHTEDTRPTAVGVTRVLSCHSRVSRIMTISLPLLHLLRSLALLTPLDLRDMNFSLKTHMLTYRVYSGLFFF